MNHLGSRLLLYRAQEYLRRYQPQLIGVTGQYQALTVAALARVAGVTARVHAAQTPYAAAKNVPLAILGLDRARRRGTWLRLLVGSRLREFVEEEPSVIVVPLGPLAPGDIDFAARTLPFTGAIINGVVSRRLDLFGDTGMVAHEMLSLPIGLPASGLVVLNNDDPLVAAMAAKSKARQFTVGTRADIELLRCRRLPRGLAVELRLAGQPYELQLQHLITRQQVLAVIAALAYALVRQDKLSAAIRTLEKIEPPPGELRQLAGVRGATLIDGSADATAEDMMDGLTALGEMPARRRLAILSDLALGRQQSSWYHHLGQLAGRTAHVLILVGQDLQELARPALQEGSDVHRFTTSKEAGRWIADYVQADDTVLIAGTAERHLEEITTRLLADPARDAHNLPRPVTF